jgi:alkylation response protein AidB-like acyl-CoA dehydrogenase
VLAKTDPEAGTRGITAFLVERGSFTNGEGPYDTMGQRASDVAMKVTVEALQIHGASGYSRALPLERYVRDAKLTQIYEGTNQIQREVLARQLLE